MSGQKTYFNWSSGKDSALALHYLLEDKRYHVDYLLTTVNQHYKRVSMHGLRVALLQRQLDAIGIESSWVELPENPSHATYEQLMAKKASQLKAEGFEYAAFGDIFLEDLREYREKQLESVKLKALFPLWKKDTRELIHEFIDLGFKTIVVCINADLLDQSFAGRVIDKDFIKDLPAGVDPCGENGEFHTFCFDAPFFQRPVDFSLGETVSKTYEMGDKSYQYWFYDLLPAPKPEG